MQEKALEVNRKKKRGEGDDKNVVVISSSLAAKRSATATEEQAPSEHGSEDEPLIYRAIKAYARTSSPVASEERHDQGTPIPADDAALPVIGSPLPADQDASSAPPGQDAEHIEVHLYLDARTVRCVPFTNP